MYTKKLVVIYPFNDLLVYNIRLLIQKVIEIPEWNFQQV